MSQPSLLLTVGEIARRLQTKVHRVEYIIRSRSIEATGWAGHARVLSEAALAHIAGELKRIDEERSSQSKSAAITTVILGAQSYRSGKAYFFDDETHTVKEADSTWATRWEQRSAERGKPNHIAGWNAGDAGSVLEEPSHMSLAGPWINGKDPSEA